MRWKKVKELSEVKKLQNFNRSDRLKEGLEDIRFVHDVD